MYIASLAALLGDLSSFIPNRFTKMSVKMSLNTKPSANARIRKMAVKINAIVPTNVPAFMLTPGSIMSPINGGTKMFTK